MKESTETRLTNILQWSFASLYFVQVVYGIVLMKAGARPGENQLILLQGIGGMVLAFLPSLFVLLFKSKLNFWVLVGCEIFGIFGIMLGETFSFYYKYAWWDDFLHTLSGFGIAFMALGLFGGWLKDSDIPHKTAFLIFISFLTSLAIALLWEGYEFTADSLFGTNMQKFMPETGALFNGGDTFAPLNGTDEEIAAFYRTGYRYALLDTMSDMLECLGGNVAFAILASILHGAVKLQITPLLTPLPSRSLRKARTADR